MIKKVDLLLPNSSQYGAIHHFVEKFYDAFRRAGLKARMLKPEKFEETFQKSPPDLTIGFNGSPRTENGKLLCDVYKIPHVALLIDPPYRFPYLLNSPYVTIGCDDRICCELVKEKGFERVLFFPYAVEPELTPDMNEEKIYDLVMLATFIDFEQIRESWPSKYDMKVTKSLNEAADATFNDKDLSFITAFKNSYQDSFDWIKLSTALQDLELYVKGKDRALLATSMGENTLHIFGGHQGKRGWKEYLGKKHPNVYTHTPVSFEESLEIMKKTKILLNACLKNKEGAHDRVFSGISSGTLVVTNESIFLRKYFKENDGLIYYTHPKIKDVEKEISPYLKDEKKRLKAVENGYKIVQQHFTWDRCVAEILNYLSTKLKVGV